MKVVELKPVLDCENIALALRNIADDIESGTYDFDATTGVLVLGRETEHRDRQGIGVHYQWQTHGLGKTSVFTGKGLLAAALTSFEGAA